MAVAYSRNQQQLLDEACLEVFGDFGEHHADDSRVPAFREAVKSRWEEWLAQNADAKLYGDRIFLATGQLDQLQDIDATIKRGLEATLHGIVVGAWTMFEVLASDLWEVAVNLFPYPLATLSGVSPVKAKRRLAAFVDDGAASPTQGKFIRMDYLQAHGFDLSHRMGTVLRERFNFQVLDGIRDAYYSAFPNESADVRTAIGADALTALAATRNLLVHRSGFVDRRFLEEQARSELLQQLFPAPTPQALLPMSGLAVHNLVQPTIQLGADLLAAIDRFDPAQMRHGAA